MHIERLGFAYPGAAALLHDWSADIGPGITALLGDTGSGKTTLLRILAGELAARGELRLRGVSLREAPQDYRRQVFYVDPTTEQYHAMTVRECIATLTADDAAFDAPQCEALLQGFGLEPHLHKSLFMLSTGSRRKVWLAAALAAGRPLTLLDEPKAALDGPSVRVLWQTLRERSARGAGAVVLASSEPIDDLPLAASIQLT
jgi:ABC-2 type transport system ATP-binding protein